MTGALFVGNLFYSLMCASTVKKRPLEILNTCTIQKSVIKANSS